MKEMVGWTMKEGRKEGGKEGGEQEWEERKGAMADVTRESKFKIFLCELFSNLSILRKF